MNEILQKRIDESANITVQNLYDYAKQTRNPEVSKYDEGYLDAIASQGDFLFREGANYALSNQWISMDEALPEFYRNVLVIFGNLHITNAYYDGEYWWWNDGFPIGVNSYGNAIYSSQQKCEDKPTHWMSIPKLNKD